MSNEKILKVINEVINSSICDFKHWYKDDFETEITIETEEDLTSGEFTETDVDCNIFDYIYFIIDGFVSTVCEKLGVVTEEEENEKQLEIIYELTKEELRKQFNY